MGGERQYRLAWHRGKRVIEWWEDGKRKRRSLGTADSGAAEAALVEWRRVQSLSAAGAPLSVGEMYEAYALDREQNGVVAAPRIRDAWKRLKPTFGELSPHHVTKALCLDYMRRRDASTGTVHIELGYLRSALRFAEHEGWVAKAPYVPMPSKPSPRDHRLTRPEVERLIAAAEMPHVKLFIVLAITTAGRAGALLDLTWDRVDFGRGRITLRDPERAETRKGRATVPMNDTARQALVHAFERKTCHYVVEWGGKKVASVKKGIAASAVRAGLDCTPHVLRHSAACLMAESGVPMDEIASYLGHSDTRTTYRVYARYSPSYLRKAAGALELTQCSLTTSRTSRRTGAKRKSAK